ncbi:hypothetical protein VTO73DRAFT_13867 [Trametes versicolor]
MNTTDMETTTPKLANPSSIDDQNLPASKNHFYLYLAAAAHTPPGTWGLGLDRAPLSARERDDTPLQLQGSYSGPSPSPSPPSPPRSCGPAVPKADRDCARTLTAEISVCTPLTRPRCRVARQAIPRAEMAHYRAGARRVRRAPTLSCVLYETGRAYFESVTLMHTLHLLSPLLSFVVPRSPARAPDTMNLSLILIEPIIAILVHRFLLALQAAASVSPAHPDDTFSDSDAGRNSPGLLQFARADIDEWIQSELDFASPSSLDDTTSTDSLNREAKARWDEGCEAALRRGGRADGAV